MAEEDLDVNTANYPSINQENIRYSVGHFGSVQAQRNVDHLLINDLEIFLSLLYVHLQILKCLTKISTNAVVLVF